MKNKIQVFLVHGGFTFKSKKDYFHFLKTGLISIKKINKWQDSYLDKQLDKDFEIIRPQMPCPVNAQYKEWKIYFESYFPFLKNNLILIGNSLGGIFLAKYLSEYKFPKKILATFLIAPSFDNTHSDEDLVGGFKLKSNLSLLEKNSKNLVLMFSKDDTSVQVYHAEQYKKKLKHAKFFILKNKNGHFKVNKFPELVKMIKEVAKTK